MLLGAGQRLCRPTASNSLTQTARHLTTGKKSSSLLNQGVLRASSSSSPSRVTPLLSSRGVIRSSLVPGGIRPLSSSLSAKKDEGDEAADLLSFLESTSEEGPGLRRDIIKFPKIREKKQNNKESVGSFNVRNNKKKGESEPQSTGEVSDGRFFKTLIDESDAEVACADKAVAHHIKRANARSFSDFTPSSGGNTTEAASRQGAQRGKGEGWYLRDENPQKKGEKVVGQVGGGRKEVDGRLLENEGGLDPKDPFFRYLIKGEHEKEILTRKMKKDLSVRGSANAEKPPKWGEKGKMGAEEYKIVEEGAEKFIQQRRMDALASVVGVEGDEELLEDLVDKEKRTGGDDWLMEGGRRRGGGGDEGKDDVSEGEDEWDQLAMARGFDEALDLPEDRPDLTLSDHSREDIIRPPGYDNVRYSMETTIKHLGTNLKKSSFGEDQIVDGMVVREEDLDDGEEWSDGGELRRRREAREAGEELKKMPLRSHNKKAMEKRRELEEKVGERGVVVEQEDEGAEILEKFEAKMNDPKSFKDVLEERDPLYELDNFASGDAYKQKSNPRFSLLKRTTLADSGLGFDDEVDVQKGPAQQFMDTYQKELPDSVKDSLNGLSRFDIFGGMTDWDDPEPHLRIDDDERYFDPRQVYEVERQGRENAGFIPESDFSRPAAFSNEEWEQLPDDVREFVKEYVGVMQTRLFLARFARNAHLAKQIPSLHSFLTELEKRQLKVQEVGHGMYEKLFQEQKEFFIEGGSSGSTSTPSPYPSVPLDYNLLEGLQPREFREFRDLFLELNGIQKQHLEGSLEEIEGDWERERANYGKQFWDAEGGESDREGGKRGMEGGDMMESDESDASRRAGGRDSVWESSETDHNLSDLSDPELLQDPLDAPSLNLPEKESPEGRAKDKEWEKADLWSYFKKDGAEGEAREVVEVGGEERDNIPFLEEKEGGDFDPRRIYGNPAQDLLRQLNEYQRDYVAGRVEKKLPVALERLRIYMVDPLAPEPPIPTKEEVEDMHSFLDEDSWGTLEQWAQETIGSPDIGPDGRYTDLKSWGEKLKASILDKANEIRSDQVGRTLEERYERYASIPERDRVYYEHYRQSFKDVLAYSQHARVIQDGFTSVDAMYESLRNFNMSLRRAEVLIPQVPTEYGRYQMRHLNRMYDLSREVHVHRTACAGHCIRLQRWRDAHIRPLVNTTHQGRVLRGLVDKSAAPHDKLTHQLYTEFDDFGRELISAFRLLSLLNERMDKGFREERLIVMVEERIKRLKRMEADLNMKEWRAVNLKFLDHYKEVENAYLWEEPVELLSKQCESDDDLQREPEVQEALQKLMAFWRRKQNKRTKNADYYEKLNTTRKAWWKGKKPNIYAQNQVNVNPALTNLAMTVPEGELRDMALECARAVNFNPRYKHQEKLALVAEFCNKLKDSFFLGMGVSKKEFLALRKQAEEIARGEGDMVITEDDPMMGHGVDPSRYLPKGASSHDTKDTVNFGGKYVG